MSKELMKKTILPMMLLAAWALIAYYFCVSLNQTEWWKIWMVVGMPFGIHRMCIWLLPKNFDLGGTVGVWAMNIIVGCLIGEAVIIWFSISNGVNQCKQSLFLPVYICRERRVEYSK